MSFFFEITLSEYLSSSSSRVSRKKIIQNFNYGSYKIYDIEIKMLIKTKDLYIFTFIFSRILRLSFVKSFSIAFLIQ